MVESGHALGQEAASRAEGPLSSLGVEQSQVSGSRWQMSFLRKLVHASMSLLPLSGWLIGLWFAQALAAALVIASLTLEALRWLVPQVNRLLWRFLPSVFKDGEEVRSLGSTWFALGVWLTLLLFREGAGGTAVLFLAWGDPAAEVAGRWRRRVGDRKTVSGSAACLAACLAAAGVSVLLGDMPLWPALAGAIVATIVERWSPPPDDNLWMPMVSGATMLALQWLLGM